MFKPEAGGSAAHDNTPLADCCGRSMATTPPLHIKKVEKLEEKEILVELEPPSAAPPAPISWPGPDLLLLHSPLPGLQGAYRRYVGDG